MKKVISVTLVLGLISVLSFGCGGGGGGSSSGSGGTDETLIRTLFNDLDSAIESENLTAYRNLLSDNYMDDAYDKDEDCASISDHFYNTTNTNITYTLSNIAINGTDASLNVAIAVSWTRDFSGQFISQSGNDQVFVEKVGDNWKYKGNQSSTSYPNIIGAVPDDYSVGGCTVSIVSLDSEPSFTGNTLVKGQTYLFTAVINGTVGAAPAGLTEPGLSIFIWENGTTAVNNDISAVTGDTGVLGHSGLVQVSHCKYTVPTTGVTTVDVGAVLFQANGSPYACDVMTLNVQ